MTTSSDALEYPSSGDFNVLVQRFKLLNLVQRVAHRDVRELIDTVGLESLARKGTLSRWAWWANTGEGDTDPDGNVMRSRFTGYGKYTAQRNAEQRQHRASAVLATAASTSSQRSSPPFNTTRRSSPPFAPPRMAFGRSTTGFEARVAAARWNNGVKEDNEGESRKYGVARRVDVPAGRSSAGDGHETTRRRYVVRRTQRVLRSSPADRDAFFARLAEPRERPEPVVEDVLVFDDGDDAPSKDRRGVGGGSSTLGRPGGEGARQGWGRRWRPPHDHSAEQRHRAAARTPTTLSQGAPPSFPPGMERSSLGVDDIRAHYYGASPMHPLHSRFRASSLQLGAGRHDGDYPSTRSERDGGEPQNADAAGVLLSALPPAHHLYPPPQQLLPTSPVEPHEMEFTPPPTGPSLAPRGSAAGAGTTGAVVASADGPVRRRSVNFAFSEDDEYDGNTPRGGNAPALSGSYIMPSSLNGGAEDVLAATASAAFARGRGHEAAMTPAVPQLHFPPAGSGGARSYTEVDDAAGGCGINAALNIPGSGRGDSSAGVISGASISSATNSPAGLRTRGGSAVAGFPKSPRVGRGLAPKAKPRGAVEDSQVPLEAVRHAAALITRSSSTPGSGPSPAASTPGNSYAAAQKSPLQPQVSSARTPYVVPAFSGGGILLSPRPGAAAVGGESRQTRADNDALQHAPDGTTPGVASDSIPVTPRVLSPTTPVIAANAVLSPSTAVAAVTAPYLVNEGAQRSFQAVTTTVDHMLQNLQRVLQRVLKDGDEASAKTCSDDQKGGRHTSRPGGGAGGATNLTPSQEAYSSSYEGFDDGDGKAAESTIEVDLGGDSDAYNLDDTLGADGEEGEEEDEMLLYTRIQHEVSRLGAGMQQFVLPNSNRSEDGEWGETGSGTAVARPPKTGAGAVTAASPPSALFAARAQKSQRARGEVPDAVVQRLCAYRMEQFQYIAYNERLWNTSTTSQFAFAQRLTAALLEECWAEVMAEVDAIMSDYVEGLVDHELQ